MVLNFGVNGENVRVSVGVNSGFSGALDMNLRTLWSIRKIRREKRGKEVLHPCECRGN